MEVPEKIYVHKSQYWGLMANKCITTEDDIEYTRTDAFIEKACEWIDEHFMNRLEWEITTYEFKDIQSMVENFKNYMKGE
jgi:hypothetical protein